MSLRAQREPTSPEERQLAIFEAETRLGRKLSVAEKRIDIVGIDRDLKNGKQRIHEAVLEEQARAVREWVTAGTPIQLRVTDKMMEAISDLYDAGVEHATDELYEAGVTVE